MDRSLTWIGSQRAFTGDRPLQDDDKVSIRHPLPDLSA